ncbi:MAG: glycosyltransferase [Ruminococcus sp.]|nr:glycosyltransferase [Ruminococcus sp.]
MQSLVSVIIPVYNAEKFLDACVGSVLAQTYKNFEIILVNDGSKDSSGEICRRLAGKHQSVVLVEQENQGVSAARNAGLALARGEYVVFADADDTLPAGALEALVKGAAEYDADLTIGRIHQAEDIPTGVLEGEEYLKKALEDNPITYSVWRILYKADFINGLEFPLGYVAHEDSYFIFTCALRKPRVALIKDVVYNYTVVGSSASRSSFSIRKYNAICELLAKKEELVKEEYPHLLPLFYHLKTKIQMVLLTGLSFTKGKQFRKCEKETLLRFKEVKGYFKAELPHSEASVYRVYARGMYYPHKLFLKIKSAAKRMLGR